MLDHNLKINKKGRNQKICKLRLEKNMSISALGAMFGITRQRVYQILERDYDAFLKNRKK